MPRAKRITTGLPAGANLLTANCMEDKRFLADKMQVVSFVDRENCLWSMSWGIAKPETPVRKLANGDVVLSGAENWHKAADQNNVFVCKLFLCNLNLTK